MVIFLLKDKAQNDLGGVTTTISHEIEHQTGKAVLLAVVRKIDGMELNRVKYWIPKSQVKIEDGKIEIPDWLWEKRQAVV